MVGIGTRVWLRQPHNHLQLDFSFSFCCTVETASTVPLWPWLSMLLRMNSKCLILLFQSLECYDYRAMSSVLLLLRVGFISCLQGKRASSFWHTFHKVPWPKASSKAEALSVESISVPYTIICFQWLDVSEVASHQAITHKLLHLNLSTRTPERLLPE